MKNSNIDSFSFDDVDFSEYQDQINQIETELKELQKSRKFCRSLKKYRKEKLEEAIIKRFDSNNNNGDARYKQISDGVKERLSFSTSYFQSDQSCLSGNKKILPFS